MKKLRAKILSTGFVLFLIAFTYQITNAHLYFNLPVIPYNLLNLWTFISLGSSLFLFTITLIWVAIVDDITDPVNHYKEILVLEDWYQRLINFTSNFLLIIILLAAIHYDYIFTSLFTMLFIVTRYLCSTGIKEIAKDRLSKYQSTNE